MEMFDEKTTDERIGKNLQKNPTLNNLKEVEVYFLQKVAEYGLKANYDVMANELPFFETLNYTEYAHCFIIHPLNYDLRNQQIIDSIIDAENETVDYVSYFQKILNQGIANKYDRRNIQNVEKKEHLIVLAGSNKLKERICLNKLKFLHEQFSGNLYFKPHPLTKFSLIGEIMDIFDEDSVLHRSTDLYSIMEQSKVVHTSHLSESVLFARIMQKEVDPIDVYQNIETSSFYHINRFLFTEILPLTWINKVFSNPKSGIINPEVDKDWRVKIDSYLKYIFNVRNKYSNHYIKKKKDESKTD